MTELTSFPITEDALHREPGGWLCLRRPAPELASETALSLLQTAAERFMPPVRYAKLPVGVWLLAEIGLGEAGDGLESAQSRFAGWLAAAPTSGDAPDDERIETLLAEHAYGWSQRDGVWFAPAGAETPVELAVRPIVGGLRVEATLVSLADADDACRSALAEFLVRSQAALRFARLEIGSAEVNVASYVDVESLDADFAHSLHGVHAAGQCLFREARALLEPSLAHAYLEMIAAAPPGQ